MSFLLLYVLVYFKSEPSMATGTLPMQFIRRFVFIFHGFDAWSPSIIFSRKPAANDYSENLAS